MEKSLQERVQDISKRRKIPRAGPTQLPLWSEHLRGLPNAMARSALFTCANQRAPRTEFKRQQIASLANYEIYYSGTELRQEDEDVLLQVIHYARLSPLGEMVEITGNQLLSALKWNNSSRDYTRLRDCIDRLKEGTLKIVQNTGSAGYSGSLIRKFAWQGSEESDKRTKWKIYLEREIIALFADDSYTLLRWEERAALGRLAKWLHSFYHSHRDPHPIKTETLCGLSGSKSKDLRGYRRELKKALDELVEIGFLKSWKHIVETDVIMVARNTTKQLPS